MIDDIDLKILKVMYDLKNNDSKYTPWFIARKIFPRGKSRERMKIIYRQEKMEKMGLFMVEKNSPAVFEMIEENVLFKQMEFPNILTNNSRKSQSIWLNIHNRWQIFEL